MTDVGEKYNIVPHWAKIEIPVGEDGNANEQELKEVRKRIHRRYKTKKFNEYRRALDPKSILANEMIEKIFAEWLKRKRYFQCAIENFPLFPCGRESILFALIVNDYIFSSRKIWSVLQLG